MLQTDRSGQPGGMCGRDGGLTPRRGIFLVFLPLAKLMIFPLESANDGSHDSRESFAGRQCMSANKRAKGENGVTHVTSNGGVLHVP